MSEWVGERDMFCRTVSLQIIKALGVLLLHHLTDFGTDWRIEATLQVMAWWVWLGQPC